MNQDLLERALLNDLTTMNKMKRLESDLIDQFDYAFNYVMSFAELNGLKLPNEKAMYSCLRRMKNLMEELYPEEVSTEVERLRKSTEDETQP